MNHPAMTTQIESLQHQIVAFSTKQHLTMDAADLTNKFNILHNFSISEVTEGLCMKGHIRTKEKCPECGSGFNNFGNILACLSCLQKAKISIPERFYIDIFWNGRQRKIYSDNNGRVLNSYELASRVLTEIRQKIDKHKFEPADYVAKSYQALQWEQYCLDFLARRKEKKERKEISPSTLRNNISVVNSYLINSSYFVGKDIRDIRAGDIEDFRLSLPKELKLSSQKEKLSTLHTIFKEAKKRGDIKAIPDFPVIKPQGSHRKWIDTETRDIVLHHIPDRHKPIFIFILYQGVRPGEARALQWEDVNLKNKSVCIRRTFSGVEYQGDCTKTKKERPLPLDDIVYKMLKGLHIKGMTGFVFRQEKTGKPYKTPCILNAAWDKAVKDAGVPRVSLYEGTRHSFASQAVQRGVDIYALQLWLGHASTKMTQKYAHMGLDGLQRVLDIKEGKVMKMKKKRHKK